MSCTAFYLQMSDTLLLCFLACSSAGGKSDDILTPVPSLLPHISKMLIKSYPYPGYSKMSQCVLKMGPVYLFAVHPVGSSNLAIQIFLPLRGKV